MPDVDGPVEAPTAPLMPLQFLTLDDTADAAAAATTARPGFNIALPILVTDLEICWYC